MASKSLHVDTRISQDIPQIVLCGHQSPKSDMRDMAAGPLLGLGVGWDSHRDSEGGALPG